MQAVSFCKFRCGRHAARAIFALLALIAASWSGLSGPAYATEDERGNEHGVVTPFIDVSLIDENGVDITSGAVRLEHELLSIGNGTTSLSYSVIVPSLAHTATFTPPHTGVRLPFHAYESNLAFHKDNFSGGVYIASHDDCDSFFEVGASRTYFCGNDTDGFLSKGMNPYTLDFHPANGSNPAYYVMTDSAGTQFFAEMGVNTRMSLLGTPPSRGLFKIVYPTGRVVEIFRSASPLPSGERRMSVISSDGLHIHIITHQANDIFTTTVTGYNMASAYCAQLSPSCNVPGSWPVATVRVDRSAQTNSYAVSSENRKLELVSTPNLDGSGFHYASVRRPGQTNSTIYTFCATFSFMCQAATCETLPASQQPPLCEWARFELGNVVSATRGDKSWTYGAIYQ